MNIFTITKIDQRIGQVERLKQLLLQRVDDGRFGHLSAELRRVLVAELSAPCDEALAELQAWRHSETTRGINLN